MPAPVYQAHPFLDPCLSSHNPAVLRHLYKWFLEIREDENAYNSFLNKIYHPTNEGRPLASNRVTSAYYLNEATSYIGELLLLMPPSVRARATPRPEVMGCPDVLELLNLIFESGDRRVSFEAQRKLYLAKLFFEVDHCWEVQRGGEHKEYFETLLEEAIFSKTTRSEPVAIWYRLGADGESMDYGRRRTSAGQECWTFDTRHVEVVRDGRPVRLHVHYYSCRFKREVISYRYEEGAARYEPIAMESWPGLTKRRSASIVSKMIRKGENDPRWIEDLIGCMFIVESLYEVENLKEILFDLFGGVFRVRNQVDTLTRPEDRSLLNRWSGTGYEVYKADVDLLYNPRRNPLPLPYFFSVEVQVYTLESYLRTVHSSHYASHHALKQRQFLEGLVPFLFPEEVYGAEMIPALAGGSGTDGTEEVAGG